MGAGGVGKSAIAIKFVTDNFLEEYDPIIEGVNVFSSQCTTMLALYL